MPASPPASADRRAAWQSRERSGWRSTGVIAFLISLLALLAALQYRWTGEVERAEEERARAALLRTAWSVSGELDGELGRLYGQFAPLTGEPSGEIPAKLEAWRRSAPEPTLLRGILVVRLGRSGLELERWDESGNAGKGALTPCLWPSDLLPLRHRLAEHPRAPHPLARRGGERPSLVPALLLPLGLSSPGGVGAAAREWSQWQGLAREPRDRVDPVEGASLLRPRPEDAAPRGANPGASPALLLLWLDTRVLGTVLLPELIARHFGGDVDYRIEVASARGETLYARGPQLPGAEPDAVAPLFALHGPPRFGERPPFGPGGPPGAAPGAGWEGFRRPQQRRAAGLPGSGEASAQWQLRVTHPDGSLSAAVARARLRNLGISLAILALLAASILLLFRNSRRAEALARRQIELVAGVSHELLTPVAALRSAGENLAAGLVTEPEAVRRYGDLLVKESSRLGTLVEQVLTWAGLQSRGLPLARQPIDVQELLAGAAEALAATAQAAGVRIEIAATRGAAAIRGDRIALERALRNLVENALKYGASGGWIGLGAERLELARGRAPRVALWVEDRGPGVDPSDLPHLFEPFYRGRNGTRDGNRGPLPGSGLGLALVQQIAREHGGRVRVERAVPQGLRFTLDLPGATDVR